MKILDATAGTRSIWYQKDHPYVTFMDKRNTTVYTIHKRNPRKIKVNPDVVSEWKDAPFPDEYFDMVVFDPPHNLRKNVDDRNFCLGIRYGFLPKEGWKQIIKEGTKKLFDVLKPDGVFIFKWAETDVELNEVLKLFPYKPMFGTRTGQANKNHWVVFVKYDVNKKLEIG